MYIVLVSTSPHVHGSQVVQVAGYVTTPLLAPITPDLTLTPSNMSAVLHTVEDLETLGLYVLDLPSFVYATIDSGRLYTNVYEKREALIQCYLLNYPLASWAHVAGMLYFYEEHTALQEVRQYITQQKGNWK